MSSVAGTAGDEWLPRDLADETDEASSSDLALSKQLVRDLRHHTGLHESMMNLTGLVWIPHLQTLRRRYRALTRRQIEAAVDSNERLYLEDDWIGARNGHTIEGIVGISTPVLRPPVCLLHWTQPGRVRDIMQRGILPMGRAVHLTAPGGRRPGGASVAIRVSTGVAMEVGVRFRRYSTTGFTAWLQEGDEFLWASLPVHSLSHQREGRRSDPRSSRADTSLPLQLRPLADAHSSHEFYVGCYVLQTIRRIPEFSKLPWYRHPPSVGDPAQYSRDGLDQDTYFGPVQAIEDTIHTLGFISVQVPCPWEVPPDYTGTSQSLLWINVCKYSPSGRRFSWCDLVPLEQVHEWERHGWRHFQPANARPPRGERDVGASMASGLIRG